MFNLNQSLKVESIIFDDSNKRVACINNAGIDKVVLIRDSGNYTVCFDNSKVVFKDFELMNIFTNQLRTIEVE